MDLDAIAGLAIVAFLAGFFDAIAGGGGLITLPALLLTGIDPVVAIGTNKFQAAAATVSAAITFAKKRLVEWREVKWLIPLAMGGGMVGALFVSWIDKRWLEMAVPILLIGVAVYFLFTPTMRETGGKPDYPFWLFH